MAEREGATVLTADGTGDGDDPEAVLMRRIVARVRALAGDWVTAD